MRNRQSVTKINTDKNVIVGQTIYDYQGRPAVNVLPVPVRKPKCGTLDESTLRYYPHFNKPVGGNLEYSAADFDQDMSPADSCHTLSILGMDSISGSSNYYSGSNPNKNGIQGYVPRAAMFPFTRTEYTPDNTGRIRRQGGVGPEFQLGSGHETKYYYGWPNQAQLDRLFGSEVGDASHYKKNMVIDAHGQVR